MEQNMTKSQEGLVHQYSQIKEEGPWFRLFFRGNEGWYGGNIGNK
jgi:hypothetical protein